MPDQPAAGTDQGRNGHVVTFYSYKGGTGRTMALANVAWILAANGHRVLVADWDLESPGLHRFFHPFLAESAVREASGIIDLIRDYEWAAAKAASPDRVDQLIGEHARVQLHALSLNWIFPAGGGLDFLSPGRQNRDYAVTLGALAWDDFYEHRKGGEFLDAVRADMKRHYDYVLIDSRTGLSDVADICTVQLPDTLVDCFTLSTQGIEGAAEVARLIEERHKDRGIRILPVPMRVDQAEKEKVDAGRATAVRLFAGLPVAMSETDRRTYWGAVEVPYRPFYAYEETLAVFGDTPGSPTSMLSALERLTGVITEGVVTSLPPMDDELQKSTMLEFARKPPQERDEIIIEYRPEDQVWAEWIAGVLAAAGAVSRERRLGEPAPVNHEDEPAASSRILTVVSATYVAQHEAQPPLRTRTSLPVYVTATRPLPEFSAQAAAFLAGVPEHEAVGRLLKLLGLPGPPPAADAWYPRARYPGAEPKIDRVPARNARFTGRENDLQELRGQLRSHGRSVVLPVTLQGLGGVGKTQVALEYAHRFRTDYDLVWWLDCGQPAFIDASLADLAVQMQSAFGISPPANANVEELAHLVLDVLGQASPMPRWLLIYDNAEDIEEIEPYLPTGNGHLLITSRNRAWSEQSRASLLVEVFTRAESVAHLRQRAPSVTADQADQVAEMLGDLPLAVATAGAWLADTGYSVPDYLRELESQASRTLSVAQLADYPQPVSQTWDLSLNRLQERSPAAARLLELCSVMAPRIALDLIYSQAMADVLEPYDRRAVGENDHRPGGPGNRPAGPDQAGQQRQPGARAPACPGGRAGPHVAGGVAGKDRVGPPRRAPGAGRGPAAPGRGRPGDLEPVPADLATPRAVPGHDVHGGTGPAAVRGPGPLSVAAARPAARPRARRTDRAGLGGHAEGPARPGPGVHGAAAPAAAATALQPGQHPARRGALRGSEGPGRSSARRAAAAARARAPAHPDDRGQPGR